LFLTVAAFGQGMVILSGGIDLSVATTIGYSAYFTGSLATAGLPTLWAVLAGVGVASLIGLVNGALVAYMSFPPFIVTLAVSTIASALLLGLSAGRPGQHSPPELIDLFNGAHRPLGLPLAFYLLVGVVAVGAWVQFRTRLGRRTYAIGNSPLAATYAGVKVRAGLVAVYWIAGLAYGVAGVLLLGYGAGSDLNIGSSWMLPSIAAVVVGGSLIAGGSGNWFGTVGAALLLTMLGIDISAVGFSEGVKQVLYGAVVFAALLLGKLEGRRE
jgi:ribose transport system permease protein